MADGPSVIVLASVGNTRTRIGVWREGRVEPSRVLENGGAVAEAVAESGGTGESGGARAVLIASVNPPAASVLESALHASGVRVLRFKREVPIPIRTALADESTVGEDRLLGALGAYVRSEQACIVIDAGTAVTVDFVDGEGKFHGGAIAPGVEMMLRALHEGTASLPLVGTPLAPAPIPPQPPFGKDTAGAIGLGVRCAVVGLAHFLIDRYAEFYGAYPRVIATGGDAPMLFESDDLVEAIVPDLALMGMAAAWEAHVRCGPESEA